MYLASKFEDVVPLHAKVVSEKIAHNTMTPAQVVETEREYLNLLDFNVNFATHFDFFQLFMDRLHQRLNEKLKKDNESVETIQFLNNLTMPLASMTMLLVKMSL